MIVPDILHDLKGIADYSEISNKAALFSKVRSSL